MWWNMQSVTLATTGAGGYCHHFTRPYIRPSDHPFVHPGIPTSCRVQVVVWSSAAQPVCERVFSLMDNFIVRHRSCNADIRGLYLVSFRFEITSLCQSIWDRHTIVKSLQSVTFMFKHTASTRAAFPVSKNASSHYHPIKVVLNHYHVDVVNINRPKLTEMF